MPKVWECLIIVQLLKACIIFVFLPELGNYTITIQNSDLVWNCSGGTVISSGIVNSWATSFSLVTVPCVFSGMQGGASWWKDEMGEMFAVIRFSIPLIWDSGAKKRAWDDFGKKKKKEENWKGWFFFFFMVVVLKNW